MTKEELLYWIWLSLHCGAGNEKGSRLLAHFGNPEAVYHAGREELLAACGKESALFSSLLDKDMQMPKKILSFCQKAEVGILTAHSAFFPTRLKNIPAPPVLLYCRGHMKDLDDNVLIACVGTRDCSPYGRETAFRMGAELAMGGACVVSGLALGVDAFAHEGALSADGYTIAVLGCGIDIVYPRQNKNLMRRIANKGLILSEYAPGTAPTRYSFPVRNRIISGLSQGTVVIEAPEKSGALITAARAAEQGRKIYAVPGDINTGTSAGANALIQNGAGLVTCAADILRDFEMQYPRIIYPENIRSEDVVIPAFEENQEKKGPALFSKQRRKSEVLSAPSKPKTAVPDTATKEEKAVLLSLTEPFSADDLLVLLAQKGIEMSMPTLLCLLTTMEIEGLIEAKSGGRYARI